jgi:predicted ATPase
VALYQDDFMAVFSLKDCPAYDEWQFFQAEELRSQLTNALVRLSSHYAGIDAYETAITHARRWLSLDPLHEPAHRHLMTLYEGSGQRAAAMRQYETCRQVLSVELGVEPSEETQDLFERIRSTTLFSLPDPPPKSNLPVQATPFIGRETELAEIRAKLKEADCRLLTLLGPGGSGKTRLAIEAAGGLLADFQHGAWFVNLAPVQEAALIPSTIAGALDFSFYEIGTPEDQLLDYLGNRRMLLILDNFEHLIPGAIFVNQIINTTPGVTILATSRTSLAVTGEHLFEVTGMAYPETTLAEMGTSSQYSAVRLFESSAKRRQPAFELTAENLPNVIGICALVEGMPLGIILAASWVRMLTTSEISREITQNLAFLEAELQDLPQRQRGLRSVFNHSWRLLSENEREIMRALSVFRGGFTRESAQEVAGASLGDLMGLIDKSIIHRTETGRFEIHELLRQFAAEKLRIDSEVESGARGLHSNYYCRALAVWERDLQGLRQGDVYKEMGLEIDNIRRARDWAVDNGNVKTLLSAFNGLCIFLDKTGRNIEGDTTCRSLIEKLDAVRVSQPLKSEPSNIDISKLQARALAWGCKFKVTLGNLDRAHNLGQKCLSMFKTPELDSLDTRFEKALVLHTLAWTVNRKSNTEGIQMTGEAVQFFKDLDEPWWVGQALRGLGRLTESTSPTESIKIFEECLAVRRANSDLGGIIESLRDLSWLTVLRFQFKKAEEMLQEALTIATELNDHFNVAHTQAVLVTQLVWRGRFHEARTLSRETLATYHDLDFSKNNAAFFHARAGFPNQYLGKYQTARDQVEYALEISRGIKHYWADFQYAVAIEILGSVALAEGSYPEADEMFQECLGIFQNHTPPDKTAKVLACMGYTARGMNKISQAQGHFHEALKLTVTVEHFLPLVHALPGIALLFADQGEAERAVELYALASTQGIVANSKWFDDIAGDEIAVAADELPAEVTEAAKARGRARDLWETAAELLDELEGLGWNTEDQVTEIIQPEQEGI